MKRNRDARFFTMTQLWQSLALVAVAGLILAFVVVLGQHRGASEPATATASTTTTDIAAAAVTASSAPAVSANPFNSLHLAARAAIVEDLSTGQTLYSQNADAELPLASLTKLLTMYAAQGVLAPTSLVTMSSTSLAQTGDDGDYGFALGETFAYSDLSRLALVASSNVGAEAIAEAAASARGMTIPQLLQSAVTGAGLSHTYAENATGLDINATEAGAYGSARDIATLAGAFVNNAPTLAEATTHPSITVYSKSGIPHSFTNTNPNVANTPGLVLSKTGYTDLAGGNLVVVFDAGAGHRIAVVVLGSTAGGRFTDVQALVHATLQRFAAHSNNAL